MATSTYFPSIDPTFSTPVSMKPRVRKNQYGNGYRQTVRDGTNSLVEMWSVSFIDIKWEDCDTIDKFLKEQGGDLCFNWSPPDRGFNQLKWSEELIMWGQTTGGGIGANVVAGPFSGAKLVADKFSEFTGSGQHMVYTAVPAVNGGDVWWCSIYAKAAERSRLFISMHGEGVPVFDLSTGQIAQTAGYTCRMQPISNGWFRCSARIIKTNLSSPNVYFGIVDAANNGNYVGEANYGLYLWGAQADFFKGTAPRGYQKTQASLNQNQYVCEQWTCEKVTPVTGTIRAQFEQVFDL